ncbi:hypothetical protein Ddye_000351 [Dipteronia dyeriana]|uniref:Uncharacterized protein n=1 Tax=Dipteronia dyeriana TaxID=168575 RepID=A0AAD9XLY2_9ROSI|nr:hypothetical protein Ddye_000351 [Dipteronia dyeriana]
MQGDNSNSSAADPVVSFCPSFNSYSSDNLVDIATRVSRESVAVVEDSQQRNDDDEFEFVSLRPDPDECELFFDGQIRQVYPLFNRDLLLNDEQRHVLEEEIRFPLKKLFIDDRDGPPSSSSSSSEADELEGVPEETYCAWTPRRYSTDLASPNRCEKSNSTGSSSSKRWLKFRDLLKRSNSEGKDPYVFLNKPKTNGDSKEKKVVKKTGKKVSAHEAFYVKNREMKEGDKKRLYLPYRRGLIGFFANVNGLGKTFPPL